MSNNPMLTIRKEFERIPTKMLKKVRGITDRLDLRFQWPLGRPRRRYSADLQQHVLCRHRVQDLLHGGGQSRFLCGIEIYSIG